MFGYLDFLFLSFSGRIGRVTFWLALTALLVLHMAALGLIFAATRDLLVEMAQHRAVGDSFVTRIIAPMFIVTGIFLYPAYAIYTKRWHDRDKSGWWSLIGFVPIIGGLWMTIELGFLGGTPGGNRFGIR